MAKAKKRTHLILRARMERFERREARARKLSREAFRLSIAIGDAQSAARNSHPSQSYENVRKIRALIDRQAAVQHKASKAWNEVRAAEATLAANYHEVLRKPIKRKSSRKKRTLRSPSQVRS